MNRSFPALLQRFLLFIMYFLKILAVGILFVNKSGIDIISRILIMDKEELYETGELER